MSHPSPSLSVLIWEEGLKELSGDCLSWGSPRSSQLSSQKTSVKCHCRLSLSPSRAGRERGILPAEILDRSAHLGPLREEEENANSFPLLCSQPRVSPALSPPQEVLQPQGQGQTVRGRGPCPLFPSCFNVSWRTITRLTIPVPA